MTEPTPDVAVEPTTCPWCQRVHDDRTEITEHGFAERSGVPSEGDVSICIRCARPGMFTRAGGVLRIRKPTLDEFDAIRDKRLWMAIASVVLANAREEVDA